MTDSSSTGRRGMDRRRFLLTALAGVPAVPLAACAQPKVQRIGFLTPGGCPSPTASGPQADLVPFLEGLRERGHVVGQTVVIECRASEGSEAEFRGLAAELTRLGVDLIFAVSSTATHAAQSVTRTIPVVALDLETDPVASGFATTIARPGGNVTGIFLDALELNGKWLELLTAVAPRLRSAALLWDATTDPAPRKAAESAARSLGIQLQTLSIRGPNDLDPAFRTVTRERAGAVIVLQSPVTDVHRGRIATLALQRRLPSIAMFPTFVRDGGLMSYGPDVRQLFGHATSFIDRVLKGVKPGEIPIERPTRFYFVINRKTAQALGLPIPPSLLGRADQVIE